MAEQIQRELSGLIRLDLDDPRVGLVTITDVEVTGDLAHAKVFFTVLDAPGSGEGAAAAGPGTRASTPGTQGPAPDPATDPAPDPAPNAKSETLAGLQRAAGFLRAQLGHRLLLRSVPQLHFTYDESVERGVRLSRLIDQANDGGSRS
ncbi:MAG: ribosome-binding factor A [bacterium]